MAFDATALQDAPIPPDSAVDDNVVVSFPTDSKTIFLGGIFTILLLAALHEASQIVMPVVLALVLKLVLQPALRFFDRMRLPRTLAASIIIAGLVIGLAGIGTILADPAAAWLEKLPRNITQLQERLTFLSKPVEQTQKILVQAEDLTNGIGPKVMPVAMQGTRLADRVFLGTQSFITQLITTIVVLFFLLAAGDTFLRRLVEILPRFRDKRQAVDITQQIEQDISVYLLTITMMNLLVGIGTGAVMWYCKVGDPILWGTLAFIMNYIPIVGPIIGAAIFLLIGLLALPNSAIAFAPAGAYLAIHTLEATFITPLLLARRFTLNPVLVILSVVFWYWMWGFAGAILAVPILAMLKIICDRIQRLNALGHFLGG